MKGRVVITCLNLPVPNRSVMQRTANKVAAATATMTLEDLATRRERVKHENRLRGLPEDSPINIAMDSRYNSATITGAYHAGQMQVRPLLLPLKNSQVTVTLLALAYRTNCVLWVRQYEDEG